MTEVKRPGTPKLETDTEIDRSRQISSAYKYLVHMAAAVTNRHLRIACLGVLGRDDFGESTASRKQHHAYAGGLVVHTAEVLSIAEAISKSHCLKLDMDVITVAVIFHDLGKIYDYVLDDKGNWQYTDHQKKARHLVRSYSIFRESCREASEEVVSEKLRMDIEHCILAHHGRQEWGSPVNPQTPEAQVIHCADWISADSAIDYWEKQ